jgi:hypothetical protein
MGAGWDLLQWPAMGVTVAAAWLIGSQRPRRRHAGFWLFLVSNVLWIVWGLLKPAPALVLLQFALGLMNLRGMRKTDPAEPPPGIRPRDGRA